MGVFLRQQLHAQTLKLTLSKDYYNVHSPR